ncbi:urea ABC transporter ATP-binding subunit UrtE [Chroococcidiopsis sp. TS-821]|uniref:urea ABC transporter ATP-binding subunit UrtE n=1 Tax=Chroococcidiopsis sp. TS-821 TaxID=1378066 RepID=UPI000CEE7E40|nr:urea ABC transporter ATP-binding subunit UrtE [Chroococcidiopsis sp. TS-821]PPS41903.1 urea ABC transporter ATP-binding subunit UrtE [Chroococcidiopsis sp. TS-821]
MLKLTEVDSFYSDSHILHSVSMNIQEGSFTTILGRNGMGKTTLLKTIMGLTDKIRGRIEIGNKVLTALPTHLRAKSGISYVPQGREIINNFTIRENILMGCYARQDGKKIIPEIVLELFPYLREHLNRRAGLLSGGQQQQLAVARALASKPKVLLLDEPTEGIQPNLVELIEHTLIRLNKEFGITIVLVEQNINFARRASDQFVMMNNGSIAIDGAISELNDDVVHKYMTV